MQFEAQEDMRVVVYSEQRCGDGCCSWSEREDDEVRALEVYEPDFDYSSRWRTDEDCFREYVKAGFFVPLDDEAKQWVKEQA